jgi:hypothetical protein
VHRTRDRMIGAVCLVPQPRELLGAMHSTTVGWCRHPPHPLHAAIPDRILPRRNPAPTVVSAETVRLSRFREGASRRTGTEC